MKSFKIMLMGLMVAGAVTLLTAVSFAEKGEVEVKVKTLNDAAAALQKSNPELAFSLTKFANEEAAEKEDKNEDKKEPEGKEEGMSKDHVGHIKLLRDSATALKQANPGLSLSLFEMADRSEKNRMRDEKDEKNEKEDEDTDIKR